jgi:hypothetical protein
MIKKINISLFKLPYSAMNVHDSFREVIDSLVWGFTSLGIECTFRVNEIDRSCTNIAFGWVNAFHNGLMEIYPPGTILYNMEQWSNQRFVDVPFFHIIAERFQIWDYNQPTIDKWQELNPKFTPYYAKVSFAPSLARVPLCAEEDIDILYIGSLNESRAARIIDCQRNIGVNRNSVVTVSGIWGDKRDHYISRSKLLLNLSYPGSQHSTFEIVRVSYYLANKKAVVCEHYPSLEIEDDMRGVLKFVTAEDLAGCCDELVHDEDKRRAYAQECFEVFAKRDVRDVITGFFS